MSSSYDLVKYGSHGLIAAATIVGYDVLVDGRSMSESFVKDDALSFAVSNIATNFVNDIISNFVPFLDESNTVGMLTKPLLNGIVYMWVYDYMMANKYDGYRENKTVFVVGAVG